MPKAPQYFLTHRSNWKCVLCSSVAYSLALVISILHSKQDSSHPHGNSKQSSPAPPPILYAIVYDRHSILPFLLLCLGISTHFSLELTPAPKMLRDYSKRRVSCLYTCPKFPQTTDFQALPSKYVSAKACPDYLECFATLSGTFRFWGSSRARRSHLLTGEEIKLKNQLGYN